MKCQNANLKWRAREDMTTNHVYSRRDNNQNSTTYTDARKICGRRGGPRKSSDYDVPKHIILLRKCVA